MLSKNKLQAVLQLLEASYPSVKPALEFSSPFELLVATILSAQCTDRQVNICTRSLFPVYHTPEQFARLDLRELEEYIHSCGFFHTKASNIIAASKILCDTFGGIVPANFEDLLSLPGVGRKTANVVLSNAFGIPAIAVDTHVFRVSNRIGLAEASNVEKTEQQLMKNIPEADWGRAHHWLIYHGRQICSAQRPKCELCTLCNLCQFRTSRKILNDNR